MPRRNRTLRVHPLKGFLNFLAWLTGVLVSLAVGFAMMPNGSLLLPTWLGGALASTIVGWVIIIATFVGVITAIFSK